MPKFRRIEALGDVSPGRDHVVVSSLGDGTFEVTGEARGGGATERFTPVRFADSHGALAIAGYWADAHRIPVVFVLRPPARRPWWRPSWRSVGAPG